MESISYRDRFYVVLAGTQIRGKYLRGSRVSVSETLNRYI